MSKNQAKRGNKHGGRRRTSKKMSLMMKFKSLNKDVIGVNWQSVRIFDKI